MSPISWMDQDETWHAGRPRPWPRCVRWVPRSPSPKWGTALLQFLAYICCGHMARWMKMRLGRKVDLNPIDIVLDWDPALPLQNGGRAPNFRPMSIVPKRLDGSRYHTTWYGSRPRLQRHCVRWGPSSPNPKRGHSPTQFSAHVYCGQTAA